MEFSPTQNPVLIVAIAAFLFLVAPLVSKKTRLPSIIVLIFAGALVGPNALGILARDATIVLLGTVGLLYLVFVAGLELDLQLFRRYRNRSIAFGSVSFFWPALLALALMPTLFGFDLGATLLVAAIVGSHTLLAYPIASRLGIHKDIAMITVVGGSLLTDTFALGLLAVVDSWTLGNDGAALWLRLVFGLGLYIAFIALVYPRVGRWFFRHTDMESSVRFLFLLTALFISAYLAEFAGAQPIIGAFLAGLAFNRLVPEQTPLMARIRFVGNTFFIPFFLLSVGMLVDVRVIFGSLEVFWLSLALIALVVLGKGGGALIVQRIFGYSHAQGMAMAGLSIPQAAATLAVTFVGLEIGLFDERMVNAVIVLILVSCLLGPSLVERFGRQLALEREREPYRPDAAPHRIMVPLANPATAEQLLDIAFVLREEGSQEAVYPLTVVADEGETASRVAAAERVLAHAVVYGAEADVPIHPLTRVAQNPAVGIVRAATEKRITDIIIGWNGERSARHHIFGSVIDQTLEQAQQLVAVCKLERPVNTLRRQVVVLPPLVDYNPGFYGAIRTIKSVASRLDQSLMVLAIAEEGQRFTARFDEVPPPLEVNFHAIADWSALKRVLCEEIAPDDLVVVVSARRGTLAHSAQLERLPDELASIAPNFVVLYPSEQPLSAEEGGARRGAPALLREEHVIFDLDHHSYTQAIEDLLDRLLIGEDVDREKVLRMLLEDQIGYAAEVLPGILIAHARVPGLKAQKMGLGIIREGLNHRGSSHTIHAIALLLSPLELNPEAHLARLAETAHQLTHSGRVSELVYTQGMAELEAWFKERDSGAAQARRESDEQ
jgi:Kef-type K+ transport system membrane component KefB/mannitol/fructose-specific phosphotransferase system IIA component (Ntr-type)